LRSLSHCFCAGIEKCKTPAIAGVLLWLGN
jgi:hypothetical protein